MKKLLSYKQTNFESFTLEELENLLIPRVNYSDLIEKDIWIKLKGKNKSQVVTKLFQVNKEKVNELVEKRLELIHLLMNTPLNYFDFHVYLSKCIIKQIYCYFPSSSLVQERIHRCYLHLYCPICNVYYLFTLLPKVRVQIEKYFQNMNRKTLLIYLKNINLNFNAFWYGYIYIIFRLLCGKFNINHFGFSIRPAFNVSLDNKQSLMDIIFLSFEPIELNDLQIQNIFNYLNELLEILSKKLNYKVKFDCEFYEVDFFEKELFDYLSLIYYRIPIDIYFKQGINPSYYQYLFSGYWIHGKDFRSLLFLFGKKSFIEELYNDFIGRRYYKLFWSRLKKEFPQYFEFLNLQNNYEI